MRVRYAPRAIQDLREIFAYVENEHPRAAARLVERIENVAEKLGHAPGMGAATDQAGIMRFPVTGTPYLIFYEVLVQEISILHIRHGARRPWAGPR